MCNAKCAVIHLPKYFGGQCWANGRSSSVQLAYSRGLGAAVDPFIIIPAKAYYCYQRFWQIPFFFVTTILFAGIVRLLSIGAKGSGSFEDLFSLFCVSQTFPMFLTMWLPETILFLFFPGKEIIPLWLDIARQLVGILWSMIIMIIGIVVIEKIKWYYSVLFTIIAAIPITGLMIIFIR